VAFTINQRYLTEHRDRLTPSQATLLERRSRQLRTLEQFHQVRESLARHDLRHAVSCVAGNPAVAAYCARQILRRWGRIFGSGARRRTTAGLHVAAAMYPLDMASEHGRRTV